MNNFIYILLNKQSIIINISLIKSCYIESKHKSAGYESYYEYNLNIEYTDKTIQNVPFGQDAKEKAEEGLNELYMLLEPTAKEI